MTTSTTSLTRVAVLLMVTLMAVFLLLATSAGAGAPPADPIEYRVGPGDTLWGIAAAIAEPDEDVRSVIHEVRRLNDLPTSSLAVGQRLLLP